MYKPHIRYFSEEDVLYLILGEGQEATSVELSPDVTVELNAQGEIIGVEILNATTFLRDTVLDSVQARLLQTTQA